MISKKFVFKNHGLVTSSIKYESYEISDGDPLSSQARLGWEFEYGRGDWAVRTVTETQMKCDRWLLYPYRNGTGLWAGGTGFWADF